MEGLKVPDSPDFRFRTVVLPGRQNPAEKTRAEVKLKHHIQKFIADESGATAIEYGLIAAGIALAIIAIVNGLGTAIHDTFSSISTSLK